MYDEEEISWSAGCFGFIAMILLAIVPMLIMMYFAGTFGRINDIRQQKIDQENALSLEENKKLEKVQAEQNKLIDGFLKDVSSELESQLILTPQILAGERHIVFGDGELSSQGDKTYQKFESNMEIFVSTAKAKNAQGLLNDTRITLNILDGEYSITP